MPEERTFDYRKNRQRERALRDTRIRGIHEMEELRRAQDLRVDDFSVQKSRESHDTKQKLTSHNTGVARKCELHERIKRISTE